MEIYKIALTGGPCAGKSSAMEYLYHHLHCRGFNVVIAPEAATQIILENRAKGIGHLSKMVFQKLVFDRQLYLENQANYLARISGKRTVVLYDRSLLDQLAYIEPADFQEFLIESHVGDPYLRYDGIVHMVSAAVGTSCYTTDNNPARTGTVEHAMMLEGKTIAASKMFTGPLRIIDNSTGFEQKLARTLDAVMSIIKEVGG